VDLQQFREALQDDHTYRFVIHDRDSIFSQELDKGVTALGVRVVRTPVRAPQANSVCERFGGTLRRECLDFLIPLNERHLKLTLKSWVAHFNHGRPHMSLGRGYRCHPRIPRRRTGTAIASPPGTSCAARRFWAVSIMNTPWRRPRRELRKDPAQPSEGQ